MDNDRYYMKQAQKLTAEYAALLQSVAGRRVRVIRAVVYEGDGETVIRQLAGSLPVGTKEAHRGKVTITVAQGEIEVLNPPVTQPPRIEVCRIDPDTLVGIAPCDDGEPGWVVMAVQPDPDAPTMEVIAPVGDEHGQIIYTDILDAAEVLKTGIVWKHDMGDGVVDLDEAVHAGPWDPMDGRLSYIGSFALRGQGERQSVTFWTSLEARHHVLVMAARHALSKLNSEGHRNVPMDEIDDTSWTFDPPATASPSPVLPSPAT